MHKEIDRSDEAKLVGYNKRGDYEIALWEDGVVTKRFKSGRVLSWEPLKGVEGFLKDNPRLRLDK